jgi:hypothetical protein
MTKPIKTIMVAVLAIIISSCAALRDAADKGTEVNLNAVNIGMTKAQVQAALNKKPDNIIAAKKYSENNAVVEVVQYSVWTDANLNKPNAPFVPVIKESYWLFFVNDKLDKWEIAIPDRKPRI